MTLAFAEIHRHPLDTFDAPSRKLILDEYREVVSECDPIKIIFNEARRSLLEYCIDFGSA